MMLDELGKKLVSVIVPVYNVNRYLDECITSIVEQTYKNIEIIVIDDGSTDESGATCDKWKKRMTELQSYIRPIKVFLPQEM